MKAPTLAFVLTVLVSAVLCNSAVDPQSRGLLRERRQADGSDTNAGSVEKTRELIAELVKGLQAAAKQALEAVKGFIKGMTEQIPKFQNNLYANVDKIKETVDKAKKTVKDTIKSSGAAALNCVESFNGRADAVLNSTVSNALICADKRVSDISKLISELSERALNAALTADDAINQMRNCTASFVGLLHAGACLGSVALKTELRALPFLTQSGILLARINLAVVTLPAALEVCAGTQLIEAGAATAGIVSEIGRCTAVSAFSTLAGGPVSAPPEDEQASFL